jgi:hypothetical protein
LPISTKDMFAYLLDVSASASVMRFWDVPRTAHSVLDATLIGAEAESRAKKEDPSVIIRQWAGYAQARRRALTDWSGGKGRVMSERKPKRQYVYVAIHFDTEDKGWPRVSGVYSSRKLADARCEELQNGAVQRLKLDKPVRFTFEERSR